MDVHRLLSVKPILFISLFIFLISIALFMMSDRSHQIIIGSPKNGHTGMVWVPGGEFVMGSNSRMAKPNEKPAHLVHLHGFWIDQTDVTNAQFAAFVKATGYVTTAERKPDWDALKVQLAPDVPKPPEDQLVPGSMVFVGTTRSVPLDDPAQWWRFIPGADWRHPQGPNSNIIGKDDHPVVQVSYEDALAYAKWAKKRLPTEAEWEYAARGGRNQATYTWGEDFKPQGKKMANTFAGNEFPIVDAAHKSLIGTTKVASYPPNAFGLYDMAGNVWQWVADWYRSDAFVAQTGKFAAINPRGPTASYDPNDEFAPAAAPKRVIRGGSFLCDKCFCTSYRVSARRGNDPFNPMSHIGFRLASN
jgi:sulfatase modifying factor 1